MTIVKRSNSSWPSFPTIFNNFFDRELMDWNTSNYSTTDTTLPAINIKENDDAYEIEVAAPGMKKSDFKVNLENNRLTISSEKEHSKTEKDGKYSRREFSYQSFQRSFTVPENEVDGDKISAKYNDGILNIMLPKKEEVKPKPAREIKIA